jgi:hypothetical protein
MQSRLSLWSWSTDKKLFTLFGKALLLVSVYFISACGYFRYEVGRDESNQSNVSVNGKGTEPGMEISSGAGVLTSSAVRMKARIQFSDTNRNEINGQTMSAKVGSSRAATQ